MTIRTIGEFDLSRIPADASIVGATLYVGTTGEPMIAGFDVQRADAGRERVVLFDREWQRSNRN
jgi:hypothetical protein